MNVSVELEPRESVPRWLALATPVLTVGAALAVGAVALLALGVSPLAAYSTMFLGTLTSELGLTSTAAKAVPLVLSGLAVYVPLKAGLWNIGAEGQLAMGAVAGAWVGFNVAAPWFLLVPAMLLAGAAVGGLWAAVPGYLRARHGVNEIIVSLMLTFVGVRIVRYLVHGPMRGGAGNFPGTATLPDAARLPTLAGSAHAGVLIAIVAVVAVAVLIRRSRLGFEVTVVGANPDAATGAGVYTRRVYFAVFVVAGLLAGLAGIVYVAGARGEVGAEFGPGFGFTAIPIALLGRKGAFRVAAAGAFFALLFVGGSSVELVYGVPAALVDVLQALVVLFLVTASFFERYRVRVDVDRAPAPAPEAGEGV